MATFNGSGLDAKKTLVDPTGLTVVTSTDVQGAIEELDAASGGGGGGGGDLAATLVLGNITDGTDIVATSVAASGTLTVSAGVVAGDQVEVAGVTLTADSAGGTASTFDETAGTPDLVALDIIASLVNAGLVSSTLTASTNGSGVITFVAAFLGYSGNTVTTSIPTNIGGGLAVAAATLTGGATDAVTGLDSVVGGNGAPLILKGGDGNDFEDRPGPIIARRGGGTRGGGAVDLQQFAGFLGPDTFKVAAPEASGLFAGFDNEIRNSPNGPAYNRAAVILGGFYNTIRGDASQASAIVGGIYNTIDSGASYGSYGSFIGGGRGNSIGTYSYGSAIFGTYNSIDGNGYATQGAFATGTNNTIQGHAGYGGAYHAVAMGRLNINEGQDSFTLGRFNEAHADTALSGGNTSIVNGYGSFAWGNNNVTGYDADFSQAWGATAGAYCQGQTAWSARNSGTAGQNQRASYSLTRETSNATPLELTTTGSASSNPAARLRIRPGRAYGFRIVLTAYQSAGAAGTVGDCASWDISGLIRRDLSNSTVLVGLSGAGTPLFSVAPASTWSVAVSADDTNETLKIDVTGEASKTIGWHAAIYTSEVGTDA